MTKDDHFLSIDRHYAQIEEKWLAKAREHLPTLMMANEDIQIKYLAALFELIYTQGTVDCHADLLKEFDK